MTKIDRIFAGGDVISGPLTVLEAIEAGRRADLSIDKYLRGEAFGDKEPEGNIIYLVSIDIERFRSRGHLRMPLLPVAERIRCFKEVALGFNEGLSLSEADRCLQCGMFPKKLKSEYHYEKGGI